MANVSDKLAVLACPLGIVYMILAFAAAQQPSQASTPAPVLDTKGIAVSLFPYPYPGHVELFEGVDPDELTGSTSSTQHPFLQENILITSLVPDPAGNRFFYIDVYTNSIYRWDNVTTTLNDKTVSTINQTYKLYEGLSRAICKLDYDYVSGNIYWSDPLLHWIAVLPVDSDSTDGMKLLLTDDVDYVAAMALDTNSKQLFWVSSAYEDGKMERSNLYGEERQVIISSSIGFVDDMTLDMTDELLYWVDSHRMTVESAKYDGTERRVIRRLVGTEFTSIAVIGSSICLVNFDNYEMQCMFKASGDRYVYHSFYPSNPYAVGFFNPGVQITTLEDKCVNTACDHICINTKTQPKCLCKDGYTLEPNGKTCTLVNKLFESAVTLTNSTHICMIQLSSLSSSATNKPLRCEVTNATMNTRHIQAHVAKNLLYYTANGKDPASVNKTQLLRFDLRSQQHWVVVTDMEDPDDIAFDWVGEKMFSCHSKVNLVKVWDVVSGLSSIVYSDKYVAKVSELAIDPHRDNIFWIADTIDGLGIYVGTFSGATPVRLVSSGSLIKPTGLSFEYLDDSVCYIDSGRFYGVTVNGTQSGHRISVGDATKSLIYKNYAIWNSGKSTLKMSIYTLDTSVYTTTTTMGTINAMTLYSKEAQTAFLDPCKIGNGGCDDICLRQGQSVTCMCDFGRTLSANNRSCSAVPLTTNFMLMTDLLHDRIVQVSMDGTKVISLPINNLMTPAMARYGHHDDMLYWSEIGSKSIRRGSLDGTKNEKIMSVGGESYPDRFAIDFTINQIYFTVSHSKEFNRGYIAVMKPKRDKIESKILIPNLNFPGGIAIDPGKGYIYFNNHGSEVYIARADSDGGNIKTIVNFTRSGGTPLGMAIDYQNGVLYWADAYTDQDKIEYINLQTGTRSVLRTDMTSDAVDVVLSGIYLYYVGYNRHRIIKVNIQTKQLEDFMTDQPELGACDSTDIVPTANTQPNNTQCGSNNGMCSHYCFARPSGKKKCGCPDGLYLDQATQLTCTTAPPKCPTQIPNGDLNPGCSALSGTSCGYSCKSDKYMKNPDVNILTCTSSMFWDSPTDTLCIEKVCDTNMQDGSLVNCQGKSGESCTWTCPGTLVKKPLIEAVVCLSSGMWSTPLAELCVQKATCSSTITNGNLQGCTFKAGASCSVICSPNYTADVDKIHCLPDGVWDQNVQTLCKKITVKKCTGAIPNGSLEGCTLAADRSCRVRCTSGYVPSVDFIHCLPDGVWDKDLKNVCEVAKVVTPEKQTAAVESSVTGLTAAVAIVVTLLVIVIALGVTFYFCRRRVFAADKQAVQGRYRASPNVYFNASDSRGEVPAQGFSNPTVQASNGEAMPNTNPLKMDQINLSDDPTKENMRIEGHYDIIKEGTPVAGAGGPHEVVNPLYSTVRPQEEVKFQNAEDVPEKPGYHRFN
ncbi:low-density lipoprotein receptor-related protein 4-like isoform X2 [Pecten maximus]|uniref:low-density lipoprotein receptor-related protein 4-like isoform X2 n=1 Tax=Pecten maximus TaxID=6579 RepID=UPI001458BB5B|nr:low-density lipoprotein receptor-related protein 4-like isoform X2 [Pecten maximus]